MSSGHPNAQAMVGGWGSSRIPPTQQICARQAHTPVQAAARWGPYEAKATVLSCLWGRRGPGRVPGLLAWPSPDAPSL